MGFKTSFSGEFSSPKHFRLPPNVAPLARSLYTPVVVHQSACVMISYPEQGVPEVGGGFAPGNFRWSATATMRTFFS